MLLKTTIAPRSDGTLTLELGGVRYEFSATPAGPVVEVPDEHADALLATGRYSPVEKLKKRGRRGDTNDSSDGEPATVAPDASDPEPDAPGEGAAETKAE